MKGEKCECGELIEFDRGAVMDEGGCWICSLCQADQTFHQEIMLEKEINKSLQQRICMKSKKVCRHGCPGICREAC